jgi:UDP-glucose 4-epimerase
MPLALVTGGAGFIGSHVAEALLARGHEVVVLDDLSGGFEDNVPPGARLITAASMTYPDREPFVRIRLIMFTIRCRQRPVISSNAQRRTTIGSVNHQCGTTTMRCFVFTSSIGYTSAASRDRETGTQDLMVSLEQNRA